MPNPIKYTTGSESDALVKGNFRIGTGSVGKGPSDSTGYYQGPNVPSGGYVIYMNKSGAPGNLSYHSAANDAELISFTNSLAGQSYTTVNECFNYYYGQTDKVLVNQDYPANYPYIVMDGLVLNLDAGITQSYPGSGTAWTDINGFGPKNNGTLTNGPTFNSSYDGSIVFDGTDDYVLVSNGYTSIMKNNNYWTVSLWFKADSLNNSPVLVSVGYLQLQYSDLFLEVGNNVIYFAAGHGGSGYKTGNTTISPNTIYNIVYMRTGNTTGKVYLNGNEVSLSGTNFGSMPNQDADIRIGSFRQSGWELDGNIYNVLMYNRALSATEVLQNYNAQKGRFGL